MAKRLPDYVRQALEKKCNVREAKSEDEQEPVTIVPGDRFLLAPKS
jgi:hypothetical protein